jgi:hypothetical protein
MMETYTREQLVELYPDGSVTAQVDGESTVMTTEEWSDWIDGQVGTLTEHGLAVKEKRRDRDAALAASDFRMVSDAPWDTAAWATYRQALRDLPDHADWPDVDLPTPPGGDS